MLAVIGLPLLLMTASPPLPVGPAQAWDFRERIESETIAAFAPTANGQLWMATRAGIRKWNGHKLTRLLPNELGKRSSEAFALAPGAGDRLWVALGGGLVGCEQANGHWLCQQTLQGEAGLVVSRRRQDPGEPARSDFAFISPPKALGSLPILAIAETQSALWLATAQGLWRTAVPSSSASSSWPPSLEDQPAQRVPLGGEAKLF